MNNLESFSVEGLQSEIQYLKSLREEVKNIPHGIKNGNVELARIIINDKGGSHEVFLNFFNNLDDKQLFDVFRRLLVGDFVSEDELGMLAYKFSQYKKSLLH